MDSTTLSQTPGSRVSQYIALTKPRVTQLAVFCAVIGMFLSTPGMVPWTRPDRRHGRHLAAGRRGVRHQLPDGTEDRREDASHLVAAVRARRNHDPADPAVLGRARRARHVDALHVRQSAHHVAHARHLRRLCGDLHAAAQAGHAAEHRDRRRVRRDAAGARLGRRHRSRAGRRMDSRADHLRVDAAAFLGARAVSPQRLRKRRPADAAEHARREVHAPAYSAVHGDPVRGHA